MKASVKTLKDGGKFYVVITRYRNGNLRQRFHPSPTLSSLLRLERLGYNTAACLRSR